MAELVELHCFFKHLCPHSTASLARSITHSPVYSLHPTAWPIIYQLSSIVDASLVGDCEESGGASADQVTDQVQVSQPQPKKCEPIVIILHVLYTTY